MTAPLHALTVRQRQAPPIDRWSARRKESGGGEGPMGRRVLVAGIEDEQSRYPGTEFDTEIRRDRGPYFAHPQYIPPPVTWISWTAAGPTRPELGMRNMTYRSMSGNTESRYPVANTPTTGLHSNPPPAAAANVARFVGSGLPQMTYARVDRLSPGQYSGQTYSQTTRLQGRGRVKK